ncbi:NADP-dependent glyceraldehyde-3-phosphate dehydrogenase [Bradyrhizobium sp. U87765 SZCCT0131]|uniref:NADP-dependent glyceraldehyde-3-phosphate dehydrogenase n=1 Tax=unclassified Bradyrhizobium TaxID=2631580 RepID=UPI001BA4D4BC|nr:MULTISPECIES: NADP-dependent glyceraldehyde-3-phosphate dehydrogenase [unclassified Bradyrhizobium]MBR1216692.1 NADP-dependent glyceraldehyde-3-phosphate dehydrogenase [Bradyrhizobium sp. U87765 SZCCT0131]MBR1259552.1 NADP-dependent glyceraldehyde-3-phosphate dehydrogenase [Bradyrhizobium sp. U87765 SZCCT0134]MBR1305693.1 NADP-dependent glyceraldehyde-3-phosphate dehydrogenase [Bradyrhizobium sp. U87765 SZCCT0110]MBR1322060.1 NADP-dependent glyceraldehyde-3-phosphate dehydrogenase [Bradyrhiz
MIDSRQLLQLYPTDGDIPAAHRLDGPLHQRFTLVDGRLKDWNGGTQQVVSPIRLRDGAGALTPVVLGSIPHGGTAEAEDALAAAVAAYDNGRGTWPTMTVADRIACMQTFTKEMVARRAEVVKLLMWEIGKSFADSEKEFDRTVDYIRATIDALRDLDNTSSRFVIAEGTIGQIRRTPLGVVLCMGPYNYPLNETFATLIPALIMGNTLLFKPPKFGVLLFAPLLEAFRNAFPKGVINTVYGQGAEVVPYLLGSGKVNTLTLIGSSKVADHLKKLHPKANRLRAILGLDAKNAAIVLADADIELAVKECLLGALSFNGQRCTALKMLIVHSSIVERFLARFTEELAKLKVGMPWDAGVNITPLPEPGKTAYMTACVEDALAQGARIVNPGGGAHCETFFYPAVVYPVQEGMKLYREEQFGPVVPVMPFDDIETALDYVITSEHGQQVSIFSSDPAEIGTLVDPLVNQVCRVNINCQCQRGPDIFPFTGRKDSAEGTLSVTDALRSFSIRSMVAAKQTEASKKLLDDIVQNHESKFIHTGFIF